MRRKTRKKENLKSSLLLGVKWGIVGGVVMVGLGMVTGKEWWGESWEVLLQILGLLAGVVYVKERDQFYKWKTDRLWFDYGSFMVGAVAGSMVTLLTISGLGNMFEDAVVREQSVKVVRRAMNTSSRGYFPDFGLLWVALKVIGWSLLPIWGWKLKRKWLGDKRVGFNKMVDIEIGKLSIETGLVVGWISMGLGVWLGMDWWLSQWSRIREILGLGMGIIYVVNFSDEVKRVDWRLLIGKYGFYVYGVILTWIVWLILVWLVSGDQASISGIVQLVDVYSKGEAMGWGSMLWDSILQATKIVGLGLVVVLGFRVAKTTFNK